VRTHTLLIAVLVCFIASVFVIPTFAPVAVSDDWVYARSVEILIQEGRLEIIGLSVVTLVFQIAWGSLFALFFDPVFAGLRLSTVVIVFCSAIALYALCRELHVDRSRSALGTALFIFNPLAFVLTFTYMTDQQFNALLVITTFFYVRGLRLSQHGENRWLLAGAAFAALAFLVRQQGALIPFAVVLALLLSRRLTLSRQGALLFIRVVGFPVLAFIAYYIWLYLIHGVPFAQGLFMDAIRNAGWGGTRRLLVQLPFIQLMYIGFFILPLAIALALALRRLVNTATVAGAALSRMIVALVMIGVVLFESDGRRMPYVPQYLNVSGLGPPDLVGERPWLVANIAPYLLVATWVCALAAIIGAFAVARHVPSMPRPRRFSAGVVAMIGVWQFVGVFPPSFHFLHWAGSLDRYLLPLLPIAVCLVLWSVRDIRFSLAPAWAGVVLFALLSIAGTRDYLVLQDEIWDTARFATAAGVPITRLDAGPAWSGYHLYEYSVENDIEVQTPNPPWWVDLFAPATDSAYVVAGAPVSGYDVVHERTISSWLHREPVNLYLLRRDDAPWPPE
jgi:4-amino-4-deoxy-L-arabinose transferase-like glycosyltransferase